MPWELMQGLSEGDGVRTVKGGKKLLGTLENPEGSGTTLHTKLRGGPQPPPICSGLSPPSRGWGWGAWG